MDTMPEVTQGRGDGLLKKSSMPAASRTDDVCYHNLSFFIFKILIFWMIGGEVKLNLSSIYNTENREKLQKIDRNRRKQVDHVPAHGIPFWDTRKHWKVRNRTAISLHDFEHSYDKAIMNSEACNSFINKSVFTCVSFCCCTCALIIIVIILLLNVYSTI